MKLFNAIAAVCLAMAVVTIASPVPQRNNDAVTDFLRNDQLPVNEKESDVKVKRRIYEENNDGHLKQISLSSLIGDLQQGLFASALSVNKVLSDKNVNIPEVRPNDEILAHDVNKRNLLSKEAAGNEESTTAAATTTEAGASTPLTNKVLLQTTEKVPEGNGIPAHIVVDRIAIQPHTGGVAFIPVFELKRTVKDENAAKDREITKITISKTEITSLANLPLAAATTETSSSTTTTTTESSSTTDYSTDSTTDTNVVDTTTITSSINENTSVTLTPSTSNPLTTSSSTEAVAAVVSTTPKTIEQLKEAEEELKEKVAEIEAEPIILSARV